MKFAICTNEYNFDPGDIVVFHKMDHMYYV